MGTVLSDYLDSVRHNLRLDVGEEAEVIRELAAHIEDRVREMKKTGLSETEAARRCLEGLGSARILAREIYEGKTSEDEFYARTWEHIQGFLAKAEFYNSLAKLDFGE